MLHCLLHPINSISGTPRTCAPSCHSSNPFGASPPLCSALNLGIISKKSRHSLTVKIYHHLQDTTSSPCILTPTFMARSGIPLPRRGLRTFFIVVNLILGPYILVHWLSTINLSDRSDRNYLLARREVDFNKINSEPESHAEAWEEDDSGAGTPRKTVNRETIVVQQESEEIPSSQDDRKRLEEHKYDRNGLVLVNPNGRHPIYDLIKRAHKSWERKVGKSSKTLKEAVDEYRRRYHRPPPRGFDRWYVHHTHAIHQRWHLTSRWKYAQKHNVQLPDEYDQIASPFAEHPPTRLTCSTKTSNRSLHSPLRTFVNRSRLYLNNPECTPSLAIHPEGAHMTSSTKG